MFTYQLNQSGRVVFCLVFVALLLLSGCRQPADEPVAATSLPPTATAPATATAVPTESPLNMANPAAVYCEAQGHVYEIRAKPDGSQTGVCILADGTECDGWAFFHGRCPEAAAEEAPTTSSDAAGWLRYTNTRVGFTLLHPPDVVVEEINNGTAVSLVGPLVNNERWPMIFISSPDTAFYRPPPGSDVHDWVLKPDREYDNIGPDRLIDDLTALHLVQARSPQVYAADSYYVIHEQQMFKIELLHSGDRQDWDLYNRFLDNFSFDVSGGDGPAATPAPAEESIAIRNLSPLATHSPG